MLLPIKALLWQLLHSLCRGRIKLLVPLLPLTCQSKCSPLALLLPPHALEIIFLRSVYAVLQAAEHLTRRYGARGGQVSSKNKPVFDRCVLLWEAGRGYYASVSLGRVYLDRQQGI